MGKIFFTSDTHFHHSNIIKYCNRPFKDIKHMNDKLVENWNNTVKQNDDIYILGDFSLASPNLTIQTLNCLNGNKHMIIGNHDSWIKNKDVYEYFKWIKDYFVLKTQYKKEKVKIILSHFPFYVWDSKHHGSIHLYGHVHNARLGLNDILGKAYNVGVDVNNYKPISLEEIMAIINKVNQEKGW